MMQETATPSHAIRLPIAVQPSFSSRLPIWNSNLSKSCSSSIVKYNFYNNGSLQSIENFTPHPVSVKPKPFQNNQAPLKPRRRSCYKTLNGMQKQN